MVEACGEAVDATVDNCRGYPQRLGCPPPSTGYPPVIPSSYPQSVGNRASLCPQRYPRIMEGYPRILGRRPHVFHSRNFWTFSVHTHPQAVHRKSTGLSTELSTDPVDNDRVRGTHLTPGPPYEWHNPQPQRREIWTHWRPSLRPSCGPGRRRCYARRTCSRAINIVPRIWCRTH